jgi:16S rRNA (adenine1518-N6/adenine1519-N6)-dimethyltransferase
VARDGKESILSLSIKAYGTPKYIMKVHKRFFSPSPKVDSAIISINNISDKIFKNKSEEELFFKTIKAGFAHKRKVLRKNLEEIEKDSIKIDKIFQTLSISGKARAEEIKLDKWIHISSGLI